MGRMCDNAGCACECSFAASFAARLVIDSCQRRVDSHGEQGVYPDDVADQALIDHCAESHTLVWKAAFLEGIAEREEKLEQQTDVSTADMSDIEDGEVRR